MNLENFKYQGYDSKANVLVNQLRDISRIARIEFPQFLTMDENYYEQICDNLTQAISSIIESDQEFSIQRTTFFKNKYPHIPHNEKDDYFEIQKKKMHKSLLQNLTENYITLTLKANNYDHQGILNNIFKKKRKATKKLTMFDENLLHQFNKNYKHLSSVFTNIDNVKFQPINTLNNLQKLLYNAYFNLGLSIDEPELNTMYSIVKDPSKSYYSIGNKLIKVYNIIPEGLSEIVNDDYNINPVFKLPQSFGFELAFGETNCEKIINQNIYTKSYKNLESDILTTGQRIKMFDQQSPEVKNAILDKFSNVNQSFLINNKYVGMHYNMILLGDKKNEKEFLENCEEQEVFFNKNYGLTISDNIRNSNRYYLYNSFGNTHCIPEYDRNLLPLRYGIQHGIFEELKSEKYNKGVHLKQRYSNNDYFLDLLNVKSLNKNMILVGRSGTGKSVTIGYLLESFYKDGATIYLTDIGFSQKNLCKKLGGLYIEITENNPIKLNPFSILKYNEKTKEYILLKSKREKDVDNSEDDGEIDYLVNLFFTAWKGGDVEKMTNEQESCLSQLITKYIIHCNQKNKNPNYNDFYHYSLALLEKDNYFKEIEKDLFDKMSFKIVMKDYLKEDKALNIENGRYYYLFDEDPSLGNALKESRFIVFEFQKIKDNNRLFNISNFLISSLVNKRMLSDKSIGAKMVYAKDECHLFLEQEGCLKEMTYASRTLRKHNSAILLATQSLNDFYSSEKGKVIVKQSSIKLIKQQQQSERDFIGEKLDYGNNSLDKLFSISKEDKKKSIYINIDDDSDLVLNLLLDTQSLLLAETDNTVRKKLEKELENNNGNMICAVKNTIEQNQHIPKEYQNIETEFND